jgi:hypothetical protein
MEKIKILGRDCHVALTLSALLAMTMWACDGTEDGNQDADACCDGDVQPDTNPDGEVALATLTVESTPVSGASVELNGTPTGEVTPHSFEKAVGHYTIQLALADYDAAPKEADLPAEGTTVVIELFPSVEGDWDLTFHNTTTGMEGHFTLSLEQTGDSLIGWDDHCEYTGSILATAEISLFRSNCGSTTYTMGGSRTEPPHLEGTWYNSIGDSGTWWADRR